MNASRIRHAALFAVLISGPAMASDWESYELGEFYPIETVSDPVIQNNAAAVVYFTGATGFFISPQGHVLTNYHVYDGFGDSGTIRRACAAEGCAEDFEIELVVANEEYDMALYKVVDDDAGPFAYIPVRTREVDLGEEVFIIGHPSSKTQRVSFGTVLARNIHFSDHTSIEYSAQTWWGSSGSPVMDREGHAVAIHWGWDSEGISNGRLTGIPFALMAPEISEVAAIASVYGSEAPEAVADPGMPSVCEDPGTYSIRTELVKNNTVENSGGQSLHSIRVLVESEHPECLAYVDDVEYHLHKTFKNPVLHGKTGQDGFPIRLRAWGYFNSRAVITLASTADTLDVYGKIRW